jgi:hypothetical protein
MAHDVGPESSTVGERARTLLYHALPANRSGTQGRDVGPAGKGGEIVFIALLISQFVLAVAILSGRAGW